MIKLDKTQTQMTIFILIGTIILSIIFKSLGLFLLLLFLMILPLSSKLLALKMQRALMLLGKINGTIILAIIYYLLITPLGFCYRSMGILKLQNGLLISTTKKTYNFTEPF